MNTESGLSKYPHHLMRVCFVRHISRDSRHQDSLLPGVLDDCVGEDHSLWVSDASVDTLDMRALHFSKAGP
jgi:hypothetical protein